MDDPNITTGDISGGAINIGSGQQHITIFNFDKPPAPVITPDLLREDVLSKLHSASSRLTYYRGAVADTGIEITRTEVTALLDWINNPQDTKNQRVALLTGEPGDGKTVIMHQLCLALQEQQIPVLAIKSDTLVDINHPVSTLNDLQIHLNLPASVEDCISLITQNSSAVVLIDQIDALAFTLNTSGRTLDLMVDLIDRLREIPHTRIVVSCRNFEGSADYVLRTTTYDHKVTVQELPENDINPVLKYLGQPELQQLPRALQNLLKRPLYLDLYARILQSRGSEKLPVYRSVQDLYRELWDIYIQHPKSPAPKSKNLQDTVYRLVDEMIEQRMLNIPESALDNCSNEIRYLERNGFIRRDEHNLSFLHQTLFSYAYARRFAAQRQALSDVIFNSPQGFFERQQIIEVLRHLLTTQPAKYNQELKDLLFPSKSKKLNYHLRLLLLKWLASQHEPTDFEYGLLQRLEDSNVEDFIKFLRVAGNNPAWFLRFQSHFAKWLSSNNEAIRKAILNYLRNFLDTHTSDVVNYLQPYLNRSKQWNQEIANSLYYLRNWQNADEAIAMLKILIEQRIIPFHGGDHLLHEMAKTNPDASCLLLQTYCQLAISDYNQALQTSDNDLTENIRSEEKIDDLLDAWDIRHMFQIVAETSPQSVLNHLLGVFLQLMLLSEAKRAKDGIYQLPRFFYTLSFADEIDEGRGADRGIRFVESIILALQHLARTNSAEFRQLVTGLLNLRIELVERILFRVFLVDPTIYQEDIYELLTQDNRRLLLHYDSHHLFAAAFTGSTPEMRLRWEEIILNLSLPVSAEAELSLEGWRDEYRRKQRYQLDYLIRVDNSLLSPKPLQLKHELLRLFPDYKSYNVRRGMTGRTVAPVATQKQKLLSDNDWLRLMTRYDDETGWHKPHQRRRHFLEGGVVELSRDFAENVKANPARFYNLSHRFDEHVSIEYIIALIQGISASEVGNAEWIFNIIRRYYPLIQGHNRLATGNALVQIAKGTTPDDVLDILIDWAFNDSDPDATAEKALSEQILKEASDRSDGLWQRGINQVRGSILSSICELLFNRTLPDFERIFNLLQHASHDACDSVRSMVVISLGEWRDRTKRDEEAIELLINIIQDRPLLLTSIAVQRFLFWLSFKQDSLAKPFLESMLAIPNPEVRCTASQIICIAGLYEKGEFTAIATPLHEHADASIRRGAARIYAQEIHVNKKTDLCVQRLTHLIHDSDTGVRREISAVFGNLKVQHLSELQEFMLAYAKSPAIKEGGDDLIEFLTRINVITDDELYLSLNIVEQVIVTAGKDLGDYNKGFLWLERKLSQYLRNLYNDSQGNTKIQNRIMNLFDELIRLDSPGANQLLRDEDAEWF